MDDQKNIKPDFSKAGEDSILYKKEEPKTEREKLKELHGKDKIWYLVHYYGLQTIVALAIIGIISFLIIHYVTQKDTALEIMAVNAMQSADNPAGNSGYYNDFLKENGLDPDKSEVLVSSNLGASANENDGASAESIQMIQSLFMTQSVDVFFADCDFFYSLGEFDYLADIREYLPEELIYFCIGCSIEIFTDATELLFPLCPLKISTNRLCVLFISIPCSQRRPVMVCPVIDFFLFMCIQYGLHGNQYILFF